MKNSLISMSMAALMALSSMVSFASSVTIPNSFSAGSTAVAADVNANFDAVAVGVNDNDSRITINTGNITTNTGNITTNTGNITTNTGNITTNTGDIATNTDDIANLQSGSSCPADMIAVGPLCVDLYEASVWDAPTSGGTQYGAGQAYPCNADGSDCGAGAANPIYAVSETGQTPSTSITQYQASIACANVGKRLPTTAEWQMAASGTPSGTTTGCNAAGGVGSTIRDTGKDLTCVSTTGALDMVGNVWEWGAELQATTVSSAVTSTPTTPTITALELTTSDTMIARSHGQSYSNSGGGTPSTKSMFILDNVNDGGPNTANPTLGFRCVR